MDVASPGLRCLIISTNRVLMIYLDFKKDHPQIDPMCLALLYPPNLACAIIAVFKPL